MRRVFITGSTDGLGRGAAETLINDGHQVVLHARSKERAAALADLAPRAAGVVIGDLASAEQTRSLAEQVNKLGRMCFRNCGCVSSGVLLNHSVKPFCGKALRRSRTSTSMTSVSGLVAKPLPQKM